MIKALIFDFDGTILDTETPDLQAWQQVYADHGVEFPMEKWLTIIGGSPELFDPASYLVGKLDVSTQPKVLLDKKRQYESALLAGQGPLPGVTELLAQAAGRGLDLAVASSSRRDWVLPHLERLDLLSQFGCIKCADDVDRVKPAPDLYQAVLAELEIRPQEAIALEDSPNGVTAAARAGIYCVAVPNAVTAQMSLGHAHLLRDSLVGLSLDDLLQQAIRAPGKTAGSGKKE